MLLQILEDTEEPCRQRRKGEQDAYPKPLGSGKQKPLVIVRTAPYMFGRKIRIHRLNMGPAWTFSTEQTARLQVVHTT